MDHSIRRCRPSPKNETLAPKFIRKKLVSPIPVALHLLAQLNKRRTMSLSLQRFKVNATVVECEKVAVDARALLHILSYRSASRVVYAKSFRDGVAGDGGIAEKVSEEPSVLQVGVRIGKARGISKVISQIKQQRSRK